MNIVAFSVSIKRNIYISTILFNSQKKRFLHLSFKMKGRLQINLYSDILFYGSAL